MVGKGGSNVEAKIKGPLVEERGSKYKILSL